MPKAKSASASRPRERGPGRSSLLEASAAAGAHRRRAGSRGRALRLLVNVHEASPFIVRGRAARATRRTEHREGWRSCRARRGRVVARSSSSSRRPRWRPARPALSASRAPSGCSCSGRSRSSRTRGSRERAGSSASVVQRERRDGFEAAFFKHLEPQPLGSTVIMSVGMPPQLSRGSPGTAMATRRRSMADARGARLTEAKARAGARSAGEARSRRRAAGRSRPGCRRPIGEGLGGSNGGGDWRPAGLVQRPGRDDAAGLPGECAGSSSAPHGREAHGGRRRVIEEDVPLDETRAPTARSPARSSPVLTLLRPPRCSDRRPAPPAQIPRAGRTAAGGWEPRAAPGLEAATQPLALSAMVCGIQQRSRPEGPGGSCPARHEHGCRRPRCKETRRIDWARRPGHDSVLRLNHDSAPVATGPPLCSSLELRPALA